MSKLFAVAASLVTLMGTCSEPSKPKPPPTTTTTTTGSTTTTTSSTTTTTLPSWAVRPVGNASGVGTLAFTDEFNTLDTSTWSPSWFGTTNGYSRPINSRESGCYHTGQATVSSGALHLRTVSTSSPDCKLRSGARASIASGIVSSNGKREFRYGYVECRVQLEGAYNWPACWTNGHHGSWPDRGELDIMELLSCRQPAWHVHYTGVEAGGCESLSAVGWHTYAMRWTPTRVDFFYDGVLVGGANASIPHDHYIILNHGVRADYTNGTKTGVDMQVDYVRVWELAS
jgi:beta-glucanase (GH16 family)